MTQNVTWPNDEITEFHTSFFSSCPDGNDADKNEWKVLKKIGNAFPPPNRSTVQSSRDIIARSICSDGTETSMLYPRAC